MPPDPAEEGMVTPRILCGTRSRTWRGALPPDPRMCVGLSELEDRDGIFISVTRDLAAH